VISNDQVWILIPAFNESQSIEKVISSLLPLGFGGCIVVDDGSLDQTYELARSAGAKVLRHPINLGVGAALRTGLKYAANNEISWVVQIDADGQHDVNSIAKLLTHREADLTIGTRDWEQYHFGFVRSFGQKLLILALVLNGVRGISDPTSGFRLFSKRAIEFFSICIPANFIGDTVEALILAKKNGLKIENQIVQMSYRTAGQPSHSGLKIVYAFAASVLYAITYTTKRKQNG
jgi:glycosyltransferase involved in cell wall biosynthesis